MAFNVYEAPYLSSYEKALDHYYAVKPIRGSKDVIKPLGKRRYHMCASIEKHGDEVHLMFERHKLIVWRPDSTFTLNAPYYYHAFQADKLSGWLPYGFYFMWDQKRLFVCSRHNDEKLLLPYRGTLEFAPDTEKPTKYRCVTNTMSVEYKARRMIADKLVQGQFEPFLAWAQVILGESYAVSNTELQQSHDRFLLEIGYSPELIGHHEKIMDKLPHESDYKQKLNGFLYALNRVPFSTMATKSQWFSAIGCKHLFKLLTSNDYEQWPYVLDMITRQGGRFWYRAGGKAQYTLSYEQLKNYLKHLVSFLYRDVVFEVKPVGAGAIPSARNAQYFVELEHVF